MLDLMIIEGLPWTFRSLILTAISSSVIRGFLGGLPAPDFFLVFIINDVMVTFRYILGTLSLCFSLSALAAGSCYGICYTTLQPCVNLLDFDRILLFSSRYHQGHPQHLPVPNLTVTQLLSLTDYPL